ncbi:MAG TPA: L-threonylcarbamoyladenylate synthase [Candidatus Krumholzibacteria bacterium]|nr:L-threonylcarbamoyladenylate synthase [Candidatus Krumholzibacteria bacterium]
MTHDASIAGAIDDARTLDLARETLSKGGVVVLPTDTLYGFSARLSAENAVHRISDIKHANQDRRYIVLASSMAMVDRCVQSYGCTTRESLAKRWPSPLSVILPSGPSLPAWVGPTVAVRIPALESLRMLIAALGEPIVSTSVNRTGQEPLHDAHEIRREFSSEVDLIVMGEVPGAVSSTLVDLCGETPKVIREGAYAWASAGAGKPSK